MAGWHHRLDGHVPAISCEVFACVNTGIPLGRWLAQGWPVRQFKVLRDSSWVRAKATREMAA